MVPLLGIEDLVKRFAGLTATDHLSMTIRDQELHAVIGPNGAGKSTLVAQISGELTSDSGSILFDGKRIDRLSAAARVGRGIVRSYQVARIFPQLTVLENAVLAVQRGAAFSLWRPILRRADLREPALAALEDVGLGERVATVAGTLSHGEKRALELAMLLVMRPRLLLLDEPMAGLGPGEAAQLVERLLRLKGSVAILLVEHDMDAVFALADRVTVLTAGHVLRSDTPERIRRDPEVQQAYLGDDRPSVRARDLSLSA